MCFHDYYCENTLVNSQVCCAVVYDITTVVSEGRKRSSFSTQSQDLQQNAYSSLSVEFPFAIFVLYLSHNGRSRTRRIGHLWILGLAVFVLSFSESGRKQFLCPSSLAGLARENQLESLMEGLKSYVNLSYDHTSSAGRAFLLAVKRRPERTHASLC